MNTIYVVAGASGSGKSVLARVLARSGFQVFELSRGIPQILPSSQLTFRDRLTHLSHVYSSTSGRVLIDSLLPDLRTAYRDHPIAIIGARQLSELDVLRTELSPPRVIAVHAPTAIRFSRVGRRKRPDAPASLDEFLRLTFWEYGLGLAQIMYQADVLLQNSRSEEEFEATCSALLREGFPTTL